MSKQELIKQLEKDIAFAKKYKSQRPTYWEGALDVLEDSLRMAKELK
jgi:hypothetical protein